MSDYLVTQPEQELQFQLQGQSQGIKQTITVTNTHPEATIAFKVKTTAPRQYSVKPSFGKLEPGQSCQVQTLLQFKEDVKVDYKRKDKFLIQAIKIPPAVLKLDQTQLHQRVSELWAQAEQISKSVPDSGAELIAQKKLRCVVVPPPGEQIEQDVQRTSTLNQVVEKNNNDELQQMLAQAQDKIKTVQAACDGYKAELDRVNQLRQRRQDSSASLSSKASTALKPAQPPGFPFPIVALIALFSFLLGAWLF
ncbi:PapD-like protein [Gorgonomyces haynaldii]|nr:PapD-like protein [Gorgonomyces haynaldii]